MPKILKSVKIIHYYLHYFSFVSLVTAPDREARGGGDELRRDPPEGRGDEVEPGEDRAVQRDVPP